MNKEDRNERSLPSQESPDKAGASRREGIYNPKNTLSRAFLPSPLLLLKIIWVQIKGCSVPVIIHALLKARIPA